MKKRSLLIYIATVVLFSAVLHQAAAASKNLLPRFPEIVLEKGFSENFQVSECIAKVRINEDSARSSVNLSLLNRSDNKIKSSVKFRILYPTSESQVQIRVNGKAIKYDRNSPRHSFELDSNAGISFEISAQTSINYSIDGVREALRKEHAEDAQKKNKKFDLGGLIKLFDREKFGRRFLVGPIASKWGVFPLEFGKVQLEVIVPSDFTLVSPESAKWESRKQGREVVYTFNSGDGFEAAVFLPEPDRADFIKTQEILTSSEFMH